MRIEAIDVLVASRQAHDVDVIVQGEFVIEVQEGKVVLQVPRVVFGMNANILHVAILMIQRLDGFLSVPLAATNLDVRSLKLTAKAAMKIKKNGFQI